MKWNFSRQAVGSLIVVMSLWWCLAIGLKLIVHREEIADVNRLSTVIRVLVERAHHAQDDLTIQNTVQAVSQIPGVTWVCISDPTGRIMADPEPTRLTKSFQSVRRPRSLSMLALHDGAANWGTLSVGFTNRPLLETINTGKIIAGMILGLTWMAWMLGMTSALKIRCSLQAQAADTQLLHDDERRKQTRSQKELQSRAALAEARLRVLVDQFPAPAVFLDDRQRVIAVNPPMLEAVYSADKSGWIGRSWQEIPSLQLCGAALEQSLQSPNEIVEVKEPFPKGRIYLQTPRESGGSIIGTWVTLRLT